MFKRTHLLALASASVLGLLSANAYAAASSTTSTFDHWQVRLRGIYVQPETSSQYLSATPGVKVANVSPAMAPEFDINYFFTPHWSTELILATTRHSVDASDGIDLGSVWALPPTLTLLYHCMPGQWFSPYAGMGVNYTWFYHAKDGSTPGITNIHYDSAAGVAFQVGADMNLNAQWSLNIDVKKILLKTTAHADVAGVPNSVNVTLNPWIFGAGVGYRF